MKNMIRIPLMVLALIATLTACKRQIIKLETTDDVNIVGFLRNNPDSFSQFVQILERTGISSYLNAYGAYTCFAPTNSGVSKWLAASGKTIESMDVEVLKDMVRLHLLQDTITTGAFTDGKLPVITMYGQYLVTGASNKEGRTRVTVNRLADVVRPNVLTGNGIVHAINEVLLPAQQTLAAMIEGNPAYSIFTQALKETGYYDSLNIANNPDTTRRWLTVLAQPDNVYTSAGIADYAALKAKYSNTGNPKNPQDSLFMYMGYHILPGLKYLSDIVGFPSHPTLTPLEVVTSKLTGQTVLINETVFGGVLEPGITLDRTESDFSAVNGVLHRALGDIFIKVRKPQAVYWDIAEQPEIVRLTAVYRKANQRATFNIGDLKEVTWDKGTVTYFCEATTTGQRYFRDDHFDLSALRLNSASGVMNWIEFTTPLLVKGRYKVWVCWRRSAGGDALVYFNGQPLARSINFQDYYPGGDDAANEANGWKRYCEQASNNNHPARLAGIIDVQTTDRHKLRLQAVTNNRAGTVTLDMIHFIPIDQNQLRPWFARDGSLIP